MGPKVMELECVRYDVADGIATITLNRPERMNPFSEQATLDFIACVDAADADGEVRAVVVTGAGRCFSAGAELERGGNTFDYASWDEGVPEAMTSDGGEWRDGGGLATLRIYQSPKPFIAAFNGPAVGFGLTITFPMDIRIASTTAKFGVVFARRGIAIDAAGSWFLPRIVPMSWAAKWTLSGKNFGPDEALRGGLILSVHEPEELLPAAYELAKEITDWAAPVAVGLNRQLLWRMLGASHPMDAHRIDSKAITYLGTRPDAAEGVMSFLEKRPPAFKDSVPNDLPDFYPWWEEPEW